LPDPAGRRALAHYLRRGGEAAPDGRPVVHPLATTATATAFRCPYCDGSHAVSRDSRAYTTAQCGVGRAIFLQTTSARTSSILPHWWALVLGRNHHTVRRHRHLATIAERLERLERVAAPWTKAETRRTTTVPAATREQTTRPALTLIHGGKR
jgi:hypothetical protein